MKTMIAMAVLCGVGYGQQGGGTAKDLYIDASSRVVTYTPKARVVSGGAGKAKKGGAAAPVVGTNCQAPSTVGLRYRIELVHASGQVETVPTTRKFVKGERVRLVVESNVRGKLTILQQEDGGPPSQLFPGKKTPPERAIVTARTAMNIPDDDGFEFDDPPSNLTLTLRVDPEVTLIRPSAPTPQVANHRPTTTLPPVEAIPELPTDGVPAEPVEGTGKALRLVEKDEVTVVVRTVDRVEPLVTRIYLQQVSKVTK